MNDLKGKIRNQPNEDIVPEDFDIGFVKGTTNVVRIRNQQDLEELWGILRKPGNRVTIWCDGLLDGVAKKSDGRKGGRSDDVAIGTETESGSAKRKAQSESREQKVKVIAERLKEKHGSLYAAMQVWIWAEIIAGGLWSSEDESLNTTMFQRAGGSTPSRKK